MKSCDWCIDYPLVIWHFLFVFLPPCLPFLSAFLGLMLNFRWVKPLKASTTKYQCHSLYRKPPWPSRSVFLSPSVPSATPRWTATPRPLCHLRPPMKSVTSQGSRRVRMKSSTCRYSPSLSYTCIHATSYASLHRLTKALKVVDWVPACSLPSCSLQISLAILFNPPHSVPPSFLFSSDPFSLLSSLLVRSFVRPSKLSWLYQTRTRCFVWSVQGARRSWAVI